MNFTILIIFTLCMAFIFVYSLVQLSLVINYRKSKKKQKTLPINPAEWPIVTVQLPVYNELYVIEELIDAVCEFDYPKAKLEIQVLDDSDDETVQLIANKVALYKNQGFDINHVQRPERIGYKAGALKYGTEICKGEFIAIFDADFKPSTTFLKETIPHFENNNVGVVQSKWGYTNPNYSMLTQLQAFGLNAHFSVEQVGRNSKNHFINFNGTAGVWRKDCISDAGGWEADTLTEDLDLSYRAQLKKWQFVYLENVVSPSELPVEINALKAQQYRWTKGAAECFSKNFKRVFWSKNTKFSTKVHALFHLMNSTVFILIFAMALLSLPVVVAKNAIGGHIIVQLSAIFMLSWAILGFFYYTAFKENSNKSFGHFLMKFIGFLAVSMGLSLHNAIAVAEGYIGRKTPFVRTPKFNVINSDENWKTNIYTAKKLSPITYLEGFMILYFLVGLQLAITYADFAMIPLLLFFIGGYSFVFFSSFIHLKKSVNSTVAYEKVA